MGEFENRAFMTKCGIRKKKRKILFIVWKTQLE